MPFLVLQGNDTKSPLSLSLTSLTSDVFSRLFLSTAREKPFGGVQSGQRDCPFDSSVFLIFQYFVGLWEVSQS